MKHLPRNTLELALEGKGSLVRLVSLDTGAVSLHSDARKAIYLLILVHRQYW